jgi:branched-chain amino acid transport system substrate-binding protein
LLIVALVALPAFSACGGGAPPAQKTLTIGGICFLTGPASAGGIACKQGWELIVDKYNAAGGLKVGKDTYKINLIVEDDAMSADQAVTAATKLIKSNGATFIIGPLTDPMKSAVYPIASQNGALMALVDGVNASGALPFETNPDVAATKPLFIRTAYACNENIPYLLDYLKANYPSAKKIALFGVAETSTEILYDACNTMFADKGLQRVGALEQVAPDVMDLGPLMTRVLSANPDAIFCPISTPITFGLAIKAAREQGFKGPMFCSTHQDIAFQATLAGPGNDTDIFGMGLTLTNEAGLPQAVKDAKTAYLAKYAEKDLISDVFLVGYNGLWVLLQTIEKAKSVDPATVLKTYEGLTTKGDLQTLWGGAYVGGKKSVGVNRVLCYPYIIDTCMNGVSKNAKTIFIEVP